MPYDPNRSWITPYTRVQPIPANEIGDATAGGSANIQTIIDNVRRYRGVVADETARGTLTAVAEGDWCVIKSDTEGAAAIHVYISGIWEAISGSGSGGGSSNVHGAPVILDTGDGTTTTYAAPYAGANPIVWLDGAIQVPTTDYTVSGTDIVFNTAPASGATIVATALQATASLNDQHYLGQVNNYTERNALTGVVAGDWVVVLDNGNGMPSLEIYDGSAWDAIHKGGAMSTPSQITADAGSDNATYTVPGNADPVIVWKGGAIQLPTDDYTRTNDKITFVEGNVPEVGEPVIMSYATDAVVAGGDAGTLDGHDSSYFATATAVTTAQADATQALADAATAQSDVNALKYYDMAGGFSGTGENNEIVMTFVAVRAFSLPSGAGIHKAFAGTAATASTTFTIRKNGTQIGTMVFAAAGTTATFSITSATSFAAGDRLTVVGPATADTTLADVGFTIAGTV